MLSSPTRMLLVGIALAAAAMSVAADPVRNGNELCLAYREGDAAARRQLTGSRTNVIHTFRFLAIKEAYATNAPAPQARLVTVEPSSDIRVTLVAEGELSRKLAEELRPGDCVAARGRVQRLGGDPPEMIVHPAILQFKDRAQPKAGKELLREVDRQAK